MKRQNAEVLERYRQRRKAEAPTPVEREAERTATDFYAILAADDKGPEANKTTIDSASFCDLMSEEAKAQTVRYAEVASGIDRKWDCASAVGYLVLRSKSAGGFEGAAGAKVVGINAVGDKATATVELGDGTVTSMPMVREDGEWKLAASTVGAPR